MSTLGEQLRIRALTPLADPDVVGQGFKAWLQAGTYTPDLPRSTCSVTLRYIPLREFAGYLASDFSRFALSCLESHRAARHERTTLRSYGWPLLKFYYAAFFGAHALMRSQGCGVSQVSGAQLRRLNDTIQIYHPGACALTGGTFQYRITRTPGSHDQIDLHVDTAAAGNGVHDAFWREFCNFLSREASHALASGEADAMLFNAAASDLCAAILKGSASWISALRNEINYHHEHEVWQPTNRRAECVTTMNPCPTSNSAILTVDRQKKPIEAFLNTSIFIASVSDEVAAHLAARSPSRNGFGSKWRKLQNLA